MCSATSARYDFSSRVNWVLVFLKKKKKAVEIGKEINKYEINVREICCGFIEIVNVWSLSCLSLSFVKLHDSQRKTQKGTYLIHTYIYIYLYHKIVFGFDFVFVFSKSEKMTVKYSTEYYTIQYNTTDVRKRKDKGI